MTRSILTKSRNLSAKELFEILQEEYIVCDLRAKIYPVEVTTLAGKIVNLQSYWRQTAEKKKDKVLDIAKRHSLLSIFDDKYIRADFEKRIIPEIGFPKFVYKDDEQRLLQEKWDRHNYYKRKSEVRIYDNGVLLKGLIESVNFENNTARVSINNLVREYDLSIVTRIL